MARELTGGDVLRLAERHMTQAWAWGVTDCCTTVANVLRDLTGADAMQQLRGAYATMEEAERLIRAAGGLPRLIGLTLRHRGFRLGPAQPATVATVRGADGVVVAAIALGNGQWVGKTLSGFAIVPGPERGWRCPHL